MCFDADAALRKNPMKIRASCGEACSTRPDNTPDKCRDNHNLISLTYEGVDKRMVALCQVCVRESASACTVPVDDEPNSCTRSWLVNMQLKAKAERKIYAPLS